MKASWAGSGASHECRAGDRYKHVMTIPPARPAGTSDRFRDRQAGSRCIQAKHLSPKLHVTSPFVGGCVSPGKRAGGANNLQIKGEEGLHAKCGNG